MNIDCKVECKAPCCGEVQLRLRKEKGSKEINPKKLAVGDWLFVAGITWVKRKNGLWKCRCFDVRTKQCRVYPYRPPLCRLFYCQQVREKRKIKSPVNVKGPTADLIYAINFNSSDR